MFLGFDNDIYYVKMFENRLKIIQKFENFEYFSSCLRYCGAIKNGQVFKIERYEDCQSYFNISVLCEGDSVSVGEGFYYVKNQNRIYGYGNQNYGVLGIKDEFYLMDGIDMDCGYRHAAIITPNKELYGLGSNDNNQLGDSNNDDFDFDGDFYCETDCVWVPKLLAKNVSFVSCGYNITAFQIDKNLHILGKGFEDVVVLNINEFSCWSYVSYNFKNGDSFDLYSTGSVQQREKKVDFYGKDIFKSGNTITVFKSFETDLNLFIWHPKHHKKAPKKIRKLVKLMLLINKRNSIERRSIYLPKPVLFLILKKC